MGALFLSFAVLVAGLYILVKGADVFVDGAKQIGLSAGMSRFAVGVLIVGFGTSLPEFASSLAGALAGNTEIVLANVVGSNITNILLIVGFITVIGGTITIRQDLLRTELPVFFIATTHFVLSMYDGVVDRVESFLLLGTFSAYLWYLFVESKSEDGIEMTTDGRRPRLQMSSVGKVVAGLAALLIGAHYSVAALGDIATGLAVPIGLVSITLLAIGTSLPELFVTLRAAMKKEHELAIGNIFGSNAFNMLFVVGIPGIMMPLQADEIIMELGIPVLVAASLILFVSGLSKRVMRWEGIMLLIFFAFFMIKLIPYV